MNWGNAGNNLRAGQVAQEKETKTLGAFLYWVMVKVRKEICHLSMFQSLKSLQQQEHLILMLAENFLTTIQISTIVGVLQDNL